MTNIKAELNNLGTYDLVIEEKLESGRVISQKIPMDSWVKLGVISKWVSDEYAVDRENRKQVIEF